MKHLTFLSFAVLCMTAATAHAGEIHYGHIDEILDDSVLIEYKSPGGTQYFTCETETGACDAHGNDAPSTVPTLLGVGDYPRDVQGRYGVRQFAVGSFVYYFLYDVRSDPPRKLGAFPITQLMDDIRFTADGNSVIFFKGSNVQRYDINTQQLTRSVFTQSSKPFLSISPKGTYLAAFNYTTGHNIWNLTTGEHFIIPSDAPSYVEFSEDESKIAFGQKVNGFRILYTVSTNSLRNPDYAAVSPADTTVEDYLFVGNNLYYMANIGNPLTWNVYEVQTDNTWKKIGRNVSYGDFMKSVHGKLAYIKVDGKNANVNLFDPATDDTLTIAPIDRSPVPTTIKREATYIADRYGALLTPREEESDTLFIWLHGGPQRQTSVNYHSYLSYAVYDELLESFVEAGNTVLKLDYTGSYGYGDAFRTALHKNIGVVDVEDVRNVVREYTKANSEIEKVYLIGNSYGGYLSLKALAENPELYAGAISINGVTDWYGLTSRIPSSPFTKLFEGVPDLHNYDAYLNASVFTGLVDKVKREKILVVYGENDASVPTWQSTQYVEFAEANDKNVRLLTLPEEGHVIKKRHSLVALCEEITDYIRIRGVQCE